MESAAELERAASLLMAPPVAVSAEDRHKAEQIFLQFRKTRNPYDLCRQILESSSNDYVLFEAASTIKEAIIREWSLLKKEEIDSICTFLLCCATEKANLQNYVREQILQVVAIIFKLGTQDNMKSRAELISGLSKFLANGDRNMELICCSIMKALLTEYSTTSQSTNFGMSLEFHAKCKKTFEEKDLLNIFMLTIQTLEKFTSSQMSSLSRQDIAVFNRYLSLAEQVLHWEFMRGNRHAGSNETAVKIIFRPHKNWKSVVLNPSILNLFFGLLQVSMNNSELSHHCMQCLIQLASMAGSVYGSEEVTLKYLAHYITCLMNIINQRQWSSHQAFGLANIFFRLVDVFPISVIKAIPQQLMLTFLEAMTFLTCTFQEAAVTMNEDDLDDNEYLEAANMLLDAWISLVSHADDFPPSLFVDYSLRIVDMFLKTHLAPPDGIRKAESENEDVLDYDIVEDDRDACQDELSDIGHLARQCLPRVLNCVTMKIESRCVHLKNLLEHEKQRSISSNLTEQHNSDGLFEDLHWLVLISAFILTLDSSGESAQIPSEIIEHTNQFLTSNPNTVGTTVKYFMTIGKEGALDSVAPVIGLITSVIKVVEIEMEFIRHNLVSSFSPEVSSTLLWFFKRFSKCYLISGRSTDSKLSPVLSACFDLNNDCGKYTIQLMLNVVEMNLKAWNAEPQVSEDVVILLLRLISDKQRAQTCLSYPTLWNIAKKFSHREPEIASLPPTVHRHLIECLMKACGQASDKARNHEMQTQLLKPLLDEYHVTRTQKNFDSVLNEVLRTFECVRGISQAVTICSSSMLFEFAAPILEDSIVLLKQYHNYTELVVAVLEMYVDVFDTLLVVLDKGDSNTLCKLCLQMMETYSKVSLGKKTLGSTDEEEKYYDLLLLIQLLTHVLSKEFLDSSDDKAPSDGEQFSPVDVVLFGFHLTIPLINQELMKYPKLSNEYFKLVTFICEVYPEKIKCLPADLFQNFMASIQMAIADNSFGADTAKCALDALSSLAKYYLNECDHSDVQNKQLHDALLQFLNIVFQYIVLGHFNMDLIEPSAESLFLLICCHQQEYMKLANNLIAQQHVTDESFKQRLIEAFTVLTPADLQLTSNRHSLKQFRKNLEIFLQNVKGFLCFK